MREIYSEDVHTLINQFYLLVCLSFASCLFPFNSFASDLYLVNSMNLKCEILVVYDFHNCETVTQILQFGINFLYYYPPAIQIIKVITHTNQYYSTPPHFHSILSHTTYLIIPHCYNYLSKMRS